MSGEVGPSCPGCGDRDHVEPARHEAGPWLCSQCWTIFDGTSDEFNGRRMTEHRKHWQSQAIARAERRRGIVDGADVHWHGGPDPCRACGGMRPELATA